MVRALAAGSDVDPDELYRQTGGNPFFVTEVLAAGGSGVPTSVRDAVLARAARLGPAARPILDAAAVVGLETDLSLLEAVVGEPLSGLEECLAAGVLQSAEGGIGFRHELARRAEERAVGLKVLSWRIRPAKSSGSTLRSFAWAAISSAYGSG